MAISSVLRRSQDWRQGTQLLLLEAPYEVLTMTRSQTKELVKRQISTENLVAEPLAECREIAGEEAS